MTIPPLAFQNLSAARDYYQNLPLRPSPSDEDFQQEFESFRKLNRLSKELFAHQQNRSIFFRLCHQKQCKALKEDYHSFRMALDTVLVALLPKLMTNLCLLNTELAFLKDRLNEKSPINSRRKNSEKNPEPRHYHYLGTLDEEGEIRSLEVTQGPATVDKAGQFALYFAIYPPKKETSYFVDEDKLPSLRFQWRERTLSYKQRCHLDQSCSYFFEPYRFQMYKESP